MKRLLFVLLAVFSANSFAVDYFWQATGYAVTNAPNPYQACANFMTYSNDGNSSSFFEMTSISVSDTTGSCNWKRTTNSNGYVVTGVQPMRRLGDGCTLPSVYVASTGSCTVPSSSDGDLCNGTTWDSTTPYVWSSGECVRVYGSPAPVQCKAYSKRDGGIASATKVTFNTSVKGPINGQTVAMDILTCKIKVTSSSCTVNPDGNSTVCLVNGTYTGETGGGSDDPKAQDCRALGGCDPVDSAPKTDTKNEPCNYATGANGVQSCTSKQETKTSGSQSCGTVNGVYGCTWNSPTSKGIDISTGISTTTNGDGSTTAVKTDVSTKTVCTDMNVCSKVTTTTKTTTTKDGNGTLISSSSTCSGAACGTGSASNGNGSGSGNGSGEGEGDGDCVTAEECGDGSGPDTPKLDEVDDYQETTQRFYDKVKGSPIASAVGNISAPESGVAPTLTTSPIQALGGASLDFGIIRDQKSIIDDIMQPTMKAFWCFVAIMIFLMA